MLTVIVFIHAWCHRLEAPPPRPRARTGRFVMSDRGQTTAEYALVLVGVAAIALLVLAWATESGAIGRLFDFILAHIMGKVH